MLSQCNLTQNYNMIDYLLAVYSKLKMELVYPWALDGQKKTSDYPQEKNLQFC